MNHLQAIIFDFDGVIVDSVHVKAAAFSDLYIDEGADIQNQMAQYHIIHSGTPRAEKIKGFEEEILKREISPEQLQEKIKQFASIVLNNVIASAYIRGAHEFLKTHTAPIPLHVASATPQDELLHIIEKRDLTQFFKTIHGSPNSKTENIKTILADNNYQPDQVLMIGDAIADYKAAQANNTRFLGIRPQGEDRIFPANIDILPDLTGLADYLAENF